MAGDEVPTFSTSDAITDAGQAADRPAEIGSAPVPGSSDASVVEGAPAAKRQPATRRRAAPKSKPAPEAELATYPYPYPYAYTGAGAGART